MGTSIGRLLETSSGRPRDVILPSGNTNNRVVRDSHINYLIPRINITKYNVLIDDRNFYDQPINYQIKNYEEIRKIATGQEMITQKVVC